MKALRRVVAITLVSAAICADRQAFAPSETRAEPAGPERTLVARLSVSFSRTVPSVRFLEVRRDQDCTTIETMAAPRQPMTLRIPISPLQFRLPPPLI
jgi:hypothetical protein